MTWPGLENPVSADHIQLANAEWIRCMGRRRHRWPRIAFSWAYRAWRWTSLLFRTTLEELAQAPKKSIAELFLGLPIALLVLEPVRKWLDAHPHLWWAVTCLVVVNFLFGLYGRHRTRERTRVAIADFMHSMNAINALAQRHQRDANRGHAASQHDVKHTIGVVLQAMCDLTRQMLNIPRKVRVHANLMVRMPVYVGGHEQAWDGCGVVCYNQDKPPDPSWTRLAIPDMGAGEAFREGAVRVIEDTRDPYWCGIFDRSRARSFVSLPVETEGNKILAVVNIDATRARTFRKRVVGDQLHRALSTALDLLLVVLQSTHTRSEGGSNAKAGA